MMPTDLCVKKYILSENYKTSNDRYALRLWFLFQFNLFWHVTGRDKAT